MSFLIVDTPLGALRLSENGQGICAAAFVSVHDDAGQEETPLLLKAKEQVEAYFSGDLTAFNLSLSFLGTAFEATVWQTLLKIPYGQTRTYGQIAAAIGKPGASRAVGRACGRNPLLLFVPCHRVVGVSGQLTGFAAGLERKRALLDHEKAHLQREAQLGQIMNAQSAVRM